MLIKVLLLLKVISILALLAAISQCKSLQVDEIEPHVYNLDAEQPNSAYDYFSDDRPVRIQARSGSSSSSRYSNFNKKNNADISRLAMRILKKRGVFRHPIPMMFNL